jgi:plastocyanin
VIRRGAHSVCSTALAVLAAGAVSSAQSPRLALHGGTITGRVVLTGKPPGNPVIRMGMDPACADMNRGRQVIQEQALVTAAGNVANVFVRVEGTFPPTPVPSTPVVIDQRSCVYTPRVVGVRVGQPLQVRNDDNLLHNVHSSSAVNNSFNVGQPKAGAAYVFTPKSPEVMLKLGCDIHRWMTAYVAVMTHPYFAVSDASGRYSIEGVPPGTYSIKIWHEEFGERSGTVTLRSGRGAVADFSYDAGAK